MASVSDTREHSSGRFRTSWWDRDGGILKLAAVVMLSWSCASAPNPAGVRAPIIDMHLHAAAADSQGPPPVAICTPIDPFPVWDPQRPYRETWIAMLKQPACSDPVWSPETDEAVMSATIEVMSRLNIYGVLSGTPERVAKWRLLSLAPGRPSARALGPPSRGYRAAEVLAIWAWA